MILSPVLASVSSEICEADDSLFHKEEISPFDVQVKFGLPNDGYLDNVHKSSQIKNADDQTHMVYSFYALRNMTVMKLLKTRKALKEILGSEEHLRHLTQIHEIDVANYSVPSSVKKLYQSKNEILEISEDINWIEDEKNTSEGSKNLKVLDQTILGLIALSAQIVRYDNLLKYVRKDMWNSAFPNEVSRKYLREKYYKRYNIKDLEIFLQGQRDALLNKYHFLAYEEKKIPLYKKIYKVLETQFHFPKADMVQVVEGNIFSKNPSIVLPTSFEDDLNLSVENAFMLETNKADLIEEVSPVVEQVLLLSLKDNYEALDKVSKPTHYKDDKDIFLYLSMNESLWQETKQYYAHLNNRYINFDTGLVESFRLNDNLTLRNETIKRVGAQTGIALALAAAVFTGGSSIMAGGAAAASTAAAGTTVGAMYSAGSVLATASAALMLSQSTYSYLDAKKYHELSSHLFLGSRDLSTLEQAKYYAKIEKSEFKNIVLSLILIGAPAATLKALSMGRGVVVEGIKQFIPVTSKEYQTIKTLIEGSKSRLTQFGLLGTHLLKNNLDTLIKITGNSERLVKLEAIISKSAGFLGMNATSAKDLLMKSGQMQKILAWYEGKGPFYLRQMVRGIGMEATMHVASEIAVKGSGVEEDVDTVIVNTIIGILVVGTLITITTASKAEPKVMFDVLLDKRGGPFARGISIQNRMESTKEAFHLFYKPGLELTAISSGISFGISGLNEIRRHYRSPEEEEATERLKRVFLTSLYYGVFVGVISNTNSQFVNGWVEPRVAAKLGRDVLAKQGVLNVPFEQQIAAAKLSPSYNMSMIGLSAGETFIENLAFTAGIDSLGIQKHEVTSDYREDLEDVYFRVNIKKDHAQYLFDFL